MDGARKDEFRFEFVGLDRLEFRVWRSDVRSSADNFFLNAARFADPLIFHIEDGIEKVLALQGTEAVLEAPACEDGSIARCPLAFQIKFRRPTPSNSVFQFHVRCSVEVLAGPRNPHGAESFDLEVPRLFHVMIVGHEVRTFLRSAGQARFPEDK